MRRKEGWERRLDETIRAAFGRPFSWGSFDCCLFAADCVGVLTGIDPAQQFRGYKTARGAAGVLRRNGGVAGVASRMARQNGAEEIRPAFAQRGDVVLIKAPRGESLGVVGLDGRTALVPDKVGLRAVPLTLAARAWRIG
jgi:hypothetical protein